MVCDLDVLARSVGDVVEMVEGARLDEVRGLQRSEGVTVEIFARWAHDQITARLGGDAGVAVAVRMWESPSAFGGYRAPSSR